MKNLLLLLGLFLFTHLSLKAQEKILVIQDPYVLMLNAETGEIENPTFIDLTALNPSTPKGMAQVGSEIWITDQIVDAIFRFDLEGNYLSSISGNMDNIKGLGVINNSEVWVTNAGTLNGAAGDAIVRFGMDGSYLGNFTTNSRSAFDVLDNGAGEVYISYISGGSPIERRDYSGNFIEYLVQPNNLSFAQQMDFNHDGDLLVANFSSNAGIYLIDVPSGSILQYWSVNSPRGVMEIGDGNILWTNGTAIYKMNPTTGTSIVISSGSAQFFARINASEGCTTPSISVQAPDPICEGTSTIITATSNGDEVNWYDAENSTSPIFTGTSFSTPALTENTTYWAQAVSYGTSDGEIIEGGARLAPSSNSSSSVVAGTSPWGLSFTTTEDFTITAVDVYLASSTPGNLVMQLLDQNWQVLEETTVACPAGNSSNPVQFEVPLNFSVEAGNTYRLVAAASPVMVREFSSEHPGFPYAIGDVGTVTGGTINNSDTNNTVYYFFYNWTVQTGEVSTCESERVPVTVTVNAAPNAPTGEADQLFNLGETLADLVVNAEGILVWYADAEGTIVLDENTELVDETTYYVSQIVDGCESELFAITVHLIMSVDETLSKSFQVYPNPVKDILFIHSKKNIDSVEILDLTGRLISKTQSINNKQLDVRMLSQGTYVLKITSGAEVHNIKIIKQ
jgi:hypothetical protein